MLRRPFNLYRSMNPWNEIERMQREMNRLFDQYSSPHVQMAPSFPSINVWTNEEGAMVTAELPGVSIDDIDITVVGKTLRLTGNRPAPELADDVRVHRRERTHGTFTRTFQLPFNVETDNVEAVFENGVLHINLPRAEAEKPRKISVKTASA